MKARIGTSFTGSPLKTSKPCGTSFTDHPEDAAMLRPLLLRLERRYRAARQGRLKRVAKG